MIIYCSSPVYEFEGWTFEGGPCGPWPLRKDGEPRARAGRKFYAMFEKWDALSDEDKKKTRVGGGGQIMNTNRHPQESKII